MLRPLCWGPVGRACRGGGCEHESEWGICLASGFCKWDGQCRQRPEQTGPAPRASGDRQRVLGRVARSLQAVRSGLSSQDAPKPAFCAKNLPFDVSRGAFSLTVQKSLLFVSFLRMKLTLSFPLDPSPTLNADSERTRPPRGGWTRPRLVEPQAPTSPCLRLLAA